MEPCVILEEWKKKVKLRGKKEQIEEAKLKEEAKIIEERLILDCNIGFDQIAQAIISDPSICLQRHFSVYNIDKF